MTALVVPFELASPSPSADMLPVRVRLDARESVVVLRAAGELVAPSGSSAEPSSASARRLRPSTWRAAGSVVEARAPCLGASVLEAGTVGSVLWCRREAAAPVEEGAERSVLGGDRGRGVVEGLSALVGVGMGAVERGLRSATASSAGASISRCVRPLTGRKRRSWVVGIGARSRCREVQVSLGCLPEGVSGGLVSLCLLVCVSWRARRRRCRPRCVCIGYGVCGVYGKGQEGLDDGIRRAWVIWTCGRLLADVAYHAAAATAARLAGSALLALFVPVDSVRKRQEMLVAVVCCPATATLRACGRGGLGDGGRTHVVNEAQP